LLVLAAAALLLTGLAVEVCLAADTGRIPVTRWVGPEGSRPITFAEWEAQTGPPLPFEVSRRGLWKSPAVREEAQSVLIVVKTSLYDSIAQSLGQYCADLQQEGHALEVLTVSGGTPAEFRSLLQDRYAQGLDGCVLIGDLPVPWFQIVDDFEGDSIPDGYEEFPIDLYYGDLDGTWADLYHDVGSTLVPGPDGILDTHTGNVEPEIWVGRLTPSPLMQTSTPEASLLQTYFSRNHRYRQMRLTRPDVALVYVDDDWVPWAAEWSSDASLAYPARVTVSDRETTWAPDYRVRLDTPFHSILVCAHSWPGGHAFKYNSSLWSYMYVSELPGIDPEAFFYNLFACSNARYVEREYMGGWYIFCQSYGLGAVGSTKTGSMLDFEYFYGPFGEGKCWGEALKDWFVALAPGGYTIDERSWFYGMTCLGDPTLTLAPRGQQPRYKTENDTKGMGHGLGQIPEVQPD
jgi:hypothetical protein